MMESRSPRVPATTIRLRAGSVRKMVAWGAIDLMMRSISAAAT